MSVFKGSDFIKNVITLVTGTSLAQLVSIVGIFVLAKMLGPGPMGIFGYYTAAATIVASFSTLQYFNAIIIPKENEDAFNILSSSLILGVVMAVLSVILLYFFNHYFVTLLKLEEFPNLLYFLPLSIILGCGRDSLIIWSNRQSKYRRIANSRILTSITTVAVSLVLAFIYESALMLVIGFLAGQLVGVLYLLILGYKQDPLFTPTVSKMKEQLKKYSNFPKYTLPAEAFRITGNNQIILLIGSILNPVVAGHYNMTNKALGVPTTVIGNAFTEVFKQKASQQYNEIGNCSKLYVGMLKNLAVMSFLPFLILMFIGPWLFEFVLGPEWRMAGVYVQCLAPMFFFKFFTSPLSFLYHLANKQKEELAISIYILVSSFLILKYMLPIEVKQALLAFSLNYVLIYLYIIIRGFKFAQGK